MTINLPSALVLLDKKQKLSGGISLRKYEDDEIARMKAEPSYKSGLQFLMEPDYQNIAKRIPPLQSIIQFKILEDQKVGFERLINKSFMNSERYNTSQNIYFGTLISPSFNASVTHLEKHDEYLVVLNETFWEGLRYISDIFSAPIDLKSDGAGFDINFQYAQQHTARFGEVIYRIVNSEHLYEIPIEPDSNKSHTWNSLWTLLHGSMESFAFGHEYGHFVRRHKFRSDLPIPEKWASEYDADRVALDLIAMAAIQEDKASNNVGFNIIFHLCGCYLLYSLFDIIDEFNFQVSSPTDTHPPTILRFANYKRACFEQLGEGFFSILDEFISSLHELERFYIRNSFGKILQDSLDAYNISSRIERAFQKSVFWSIFDRTHVQSISYLEGLCKKIDGMSENNNMPQVKDFSSLCRDDAGRLASLVSLEVLSDEGVELLFEFALKRGVILKSDAINMVNNCIEIYKQNIAARAVRMQ